MTNPRNTSRWRRLRQQLIADATACAICGHPLMHQAKPRSRWSPSADHILPLARGGNPFDPANIRITHYGCNARRAARIRNFGADPPPPEPAAARVEPWRSREW